MKKTLTSTLAVLLMSPYVFAAELCSEAKIKILEDQKFVERFLDQYKLDECHSIQIFKRRSSKLDCIANIKILEKSQPHHQEFPYEIIDCNSMLVKTQ